MKNKKWIVVFLVILTVAITLFAAASFAALSNLYDNKIFSDISDFDFLEAYETGSNPLHDKYLEDLNPAEAYVSSIEYERETYRVYAYIFNSPDDAYEYIKRSSGERDAGQRTCDYFKFSRYFWGSRFWAYNGNCAYRVEGGAYVPFAQFMTWLTKDFPYDLRSLYFAQSGVIE